jgi:hypothetical protein
MTASDVQDAKWWRTTYVLFFTAFIVTYAACASSVYQGLSAGRPTLENPHPAHITGFPAWFAFITALLPAFVVSIVTASIRILIRIIRERAIRRT